LTFDLERLKSIGCYVIKLIKFERNRTIRDWVIAI